MRGLWLAVAVISLGLAFIGAVLPGMPSTVFVLIAAWAAARSSPRFHAWLSKHRWFGPSLANWSDGRKVSRRAKWGASASMALCAVILYLTAFSPWLTGFAMLSMACVLAWLWSRPEPDTPKQSPGND
ncbi:YbaN family protein [Mesopusillimonas faecipullorum]|nr:YbaN family protein [Mesopusillimonas faecipullorum]